jgi:hypothetical protein
VLRGYRLPGISEVFVLHSPALVWRVEVSGEFVVSACDRSPPPPPPPAPPVAMDQPPPPPPPPAPPGNAYAIYVWNWQRRELAHMFTAHHRPVYGLHVLGTSVLVSSLLSSVCS